MEELLNLDVANLEKINFNYYIENIETLLAGRRQEYEIFGVTTEDLKTDRLLEAKLKELKENQ